MNTKLKVGDLVTVLEVTGGKYHLGTSLVDGSVSSIAAGFINNIAEVMQVDSDNTALLRLLDTPIINYWFDAVDIKKL